MAASLRLGDSRKITAILLDITGVLYESGEGGGKVIQGSPEAVKRSGATSSTCQLAHVARYLCTYLYLLAACKVLELTSYDMKRTTVACNSHPRTGLACVPQL